MSETTAAREWQSGYDRTALWLARNRPELEESREHLAESKAGTPFLAGGVRALADYIAGLSEDGQSAPPPSSKAIDATALDHIAALLDGVEWSPDTLEDIAAAVRSTGRQVRESAEVGEPDDITCSELDQTGEDSQR